MRFSFSALDYRQKSLFAEISYLFVIGVLSPLAVGLQIFSWFSYTLSLTLLNLLQLPSIVLFYRGYLPYTVGRKKYILLILLFPVYMFIYDFNVRMAIWTLLLLPFIPKSYQQQISGANPTDFTKGYFNESIGYTLLVLLAATSLYVVRLLFKNQHSLYTVEAEKLKLELNQLKSQVQPHFFFNTLNNLYALSIQQSPRTPEMINDLSGVMRYVLYDTAQERVPLEQEVEFIKSYIRLENMRHSPDAVIDFNIQGELKNISVAPLLFLPLIENTFKHSLHLNIPEKWVKLTLSVDKDELVFQSSNPKEACEKLLQKERSGIGLMNVNKRLELLYPGRHELVIHDKLESFTVTLSIQLK